MTRASSPAREARALPAPEPRSIRLTHVSSDRPLALTPMERGSITAAIADSLGKRGAAQQLQQPATRWPLGAASGIPKTAHLST